MLHSRGFGSCTASERLEPDSTHREANNSHRDAAAFAAVARFNRGKTRGFGGGGSAVGGPRDFTPKVDGAAGRAASDDGEAACRDEGARIIARLYYELHVVNVVVKD